LKSSVPSAHTRTRININGSVTSSGSNNIIGVRIAYIPFPLD
jgi:hypothetical protein